MVQRPRTRRVAARPAMTIPERLRKGRATRAQPTALVGLSLGARDVGGTVARTSEPPSPSSLGLNCGCFAPVACQWLLLDPVGDVLGLTRRVIPGVARWHVLRRAPRHGADRRRSPH